MNPTALIAEDEPLLAAGLAADLARLWPELRLVASVGDGLAAVQQTLALKPDLCFFDIRMPGASGLEAAQALAEDWPDGSAFPLLVFVTAYGDHALEAFEAQAVDYLIKPPDAAKLAACVQRLQRRLAARQRPGQATPALEEAIGQLRGLLGTAAPQQPRLAVIQAQVGAVVHLVPVEDVVYFEAADKYVRVLTEDREHLIRTSLRELLPQLDPQQFWQVHRGTVVQARRIAQARREESGKVTLTLRGRPEAVTVSRLYAHLFKGM
jgi:DNA-binding LytR/AlgR family response regulator